MGQQTGSKLGKIYDKADYFTSMWNAGLDESQARIKIARRNINNLRYTDDPTLMAEPKEELQTGSKSGKEYVKAAYCHPAYLT